MRFEQIVDKNLVEQTLLRIGFENGKICPFKETYPPRHVKNMKIAAIEAWMTSTELST